MTSCPGVDASSGRVSSGRDRALRHYWRQSTLQLSANKILYSRGALYTIAVHGTTGELSSCTATHKCHQPVVVYIQTAAHQQHNNIRPTTILKQHYNILNSSRAQSQTPSAAVMIHALPSSRTLAITLTHDLCMTLTFKPRLAMVVTHTRAKMKVKRQIVQQLE